MKLMNWCKPKHSVCSVCGVHFEPLTGYMARWGNLCAVHRKPIQERDEKKEAVIRWATNNWERLADMMEKENAEMRDAYDKLHRAGMAALAHAGMSQQSGKGK